VNGKVNGDYARGKIRMDHGPDWFVGGKQRGDVEVWTAAKNGNMVLRTFVPVGVTLSPFFSAGSRTPWIKLCVLIGRPGLG